MRILFDQATPVPIRKFLAGHEVITAYQQGWDKIANGELIALAEENGFDLFLTPDKNIAYQQNLTNRNIAIVVIGKGNWSTIEPHVDKIVDAVNLSTPGSYTFADIS
jgi:predicted nuclease of predicted toxin-antitoxin system